MDINFDKAFQFLYNYSWIYDFKITHYLVNEVWKQIPAEWQDVLLSLSTEQLNNLPFGYHEDEWPESFKAFLQQSLMLSLKREPHTSLQPTPINLSLKRGMVPKKEHEVSYMSDLVHRVCVRNNCDVIIDIGSGLGYLGQVLSDHYSYKIIGVEGREGNTHGADKRSCRQNELQSQIRNITFALNQNQQSFTAFRSLILDCLNSESHYDGNSLARSEASENEARQNEDVTKIFVDENYEKDSKVNPENNGKQKSSQAYENSHRVNTECGMCDSDKTTTLHTHEMKLPPYKVNGAPRICMVGLHCCGDLTPVMMSYFNRLEVIKCFCSVSCCYHRMKYTDSNDTFENFPLSQRAKDAYRQQILKHHPKGLSTYAFRLAAQETRLLNFSEQFQDQNKPGNRWNLSSVTVYHYTPKTRWKNQTNDDHIDHMKHVAYRAVLEYFLKEDAIEIEKSVRRMAHKSDYSTFETYVAAICQNIKFSSVALNNSFQKNGSQTTKCLFNMLQHMWGERDGSVEMEQRDIQQKLTVIYEKNEESFKLIEPITALQVCVQPVLETLIYRDRQMWLIENGYTADIIPVFDENISPRNLALIATRR